MKLISCHFFGDEACLIRQDPDKKNELHVAIHFCRDSIQCEILQMPEDPYASKILADIDKSELPELSVKSPVRFSGWAAVCLLLTLSWTKGSETRDFEEIISRPWVTCAWSSRRDVIPDQEPGAKVLCFVKTKTNVYHLFLVYSQIQAGDCWQKIGAPFPDLLTDDLLTLPVHSDRPCQSVSGSAVQALVLAMSSMNEIKDLLVLQTIEPHLHRRA